MLPMYKVTYHRECKCNIVLCRFVLTLQCKNIIFYLIRTAEVKRQRRNSYSKERANLSAVVNCN